ncbi:MAG: aldo/keto reductase, partial [Acidobacteriota bacterium]|nr:aldo/keto reductase [Acidobacteriota bacterium]
MTDTFRRSSRRQFIKETALASSALALGPYFVFGQAQPSTLMKRNMGRLGFEATTLGLGGQASLQWTPADVDPVKIILKAFNLGVNYFDTANVYGPSQSYYGRAFRELNLIPGEPGYNERLRSSIFLTSKTFLRFGKGGLPPKPGAKPAAPGQSQHVADDLRRSLSQIFGDGNGSY